MLPRQVGGQANKYRIAGHSGNRDLRRELSDPHSDTEIMGTNATRRMDVRVCLFCVCVVLCVASGLAKGRCPIQEVPSNANRIQKLKISKDIIERLCNNDLRLGMLPKHCSYSRA
jgi:hypothetical protein